MKKFFGLVFAFLLAPIIALSGCGANGNFELIQTDKENACSFLYDVTKIIGGLENPKDTRPQDYDISLANDQSVTSELTTRAWPIVNKVNKETLFALAGYDMFKNRDSKNGVGTYDLSFMSDKTSSLLSAFKIYESTHDDSYYYFYHELTGTESNDLCLPVNQLALVSKNGATLGELQDSADNEIKTWGGRIIYTAQSSAGRDIITIDTAFEFPENKFIGMENTFKYDADNKSITYVYTDNSKTYSKVVSFNKDTSTTDSSKVVVRKLVTKYTGDKINDSQNAKLYNADGSTYEYILTMPLQNGSDTTFEKSINIYGTYKFTEKSSLSYLYCEHTYSKSNILTLCEYVKVKSGEVLSRIYERTNIIRNYDILVNIDRETGNLKARSAKIIPVLEHIPASERIPNYPLLIDEVVLNEKYASENDGDSINKYKNYIYYYSYGDSQLTFKKVEN